MKYNADELITVKFAGRGLCNRDYKEKWGCKAKSVEFLFYSKTGRLTAVQLFLKYTLFYDKFNSRWLDWQLVLIRTEAMGMLLD